VGWSTFAFDPSAYANYGVITGLPGAGTIDTVPWSLPSRINDAWAVSMQVTSPQLRTIAATANAQAGRSVNFLEPGRARLISYTATLDWRPTDQLRVNLQYSFLRRSRERDGSWFSTQHIPRFKIEYQVSRPIFLRFVGQYSIDDQVALRAGGTNDPLLVRSSATAPYVVSTPRRAHDLRADWLFSFRPTPGTVVFAGYGTSLTETDPFTFRDVRRVRDGFFVKLSYLFRV